MKSLWGTPLTQEKLCRIQQLFKETGSFDYANNLQEELLQKARQVVQGMETQDTYSRDFLFSIISYLAERKT